MLFNKIFLRSFSNFVQNFVRINFILCLPGEEAMKILSSELQKNSSWVICFFRDTCFIYGYKKISQTIIMTSSIVMNEDMLDEIWDVLC